MSDIDHAAVLQKMADEGAGYFADADCNRLYRASDEITRLRARIVELEGQHKGLVITNGILRQRDDLPVDRLPVMREVEALREQKQRLLVALKDCEGELDAYYRNEYPTDHPLHQRRLANALKNNPARVALKELNDAVGN